MARFMMSFLLAVVLAGAVWAEAPAVQASVRYAGQTVTVVWKNVTDKPLTLEYPFPIKVTTSSGIEEMISPIILDVATMKITLPPQGQKSMVVNPGGRYLLTSGEGYYVTVTTNIVETNTPVYFTFPYIMPSDNPTFSGAWKDIPDLPGFKARLVVTLFPKERISEARVEYKNEGGGKIPVFRIPFLDHKVLAIKQGELKPDSVIGKDWGEKLETISLPGFATIGLPTAQDNFDPIPEDRLSLWLHYRQYLLKPGEEYLIDASVLIPVGEKKVNAWLAPLNFTVPNPAEAKVDSPVQVSIRYLDGKPEAISFTNTSAHELKFVTGKGSGSDLIRTYNGEGYQANPTTSDRMPGLWFKPDTAIAANSSVDFPIRMTYVIRVDEVYSMVGIWKLIDVETKQEHIVSARWPYISPVSSPTFTGEWTPVKERPGMELRMRCKLSRMNPPSLGWQPTTWLEYRNVGNDSVRVFNYPTLDLKMTDSKGKAPYEDNHKPTFTPNIEELLLPAGAILTLPCVHSEQKWIDPPKDLTHALYFDNKIYALADGERYTLQGTVKLPGDEKGKDISAPFAPVTVLVTAK